MRQPPNRSVLPVADFNPDPQWPGGYFEVLEESGVPEKQHGFYAHWVRQLFNRYPERFRRPLGPQEIADWGLGNSIHIPHPWYAERHPWSPPLNSIRGTPNGIRGRYP